MFQLFLCLCPSAAQLSSAGCKPGQGLSCFTNEGASCGLIGFGMTCSSVPGTLAFLSVYLSIPPPSITPAPKPTLNWKPWVKARRWAVRAIKLERRGKKRTPPSILPLSPPSSPSIFLYGCWKARPGIKKVRWLERKKAIWALQRYVTGQESGEHYNSTSVISLGSPGGPPLTGREISQR